MFPSCACQIPRDANADTERGQNDYIKATFLSDPRVQLSGFLTGLTSSRFYGICPKACAVLFFLFSALNINFSHLPTCVTVSRLALSRHSPALGFDKNRLIFFYLSFFFSFHKWRLCGFLFPEATNSERQNVKEFLGSNSVCSTIVTTLNTRLCLRCIFILSRQQLRTNKI